MTALVTLNSPLLARLRAETQERHAQLDALVADAVLTSIGGYAAFLTASLLAISAIEPGLTRKLGADFNGERAASLRADLLQLGVPPATPALVLSPYEPPTIAAAWGCAYVVEGSALGGQVLAKRVEAALGPSVPLKYLSLRGSLTTAHWRAFLGQLSQFAFGASEDQQAEAVAAALMTFDFYSSAFQRVLPRGR